MHVRCEFNDYTSTENAISFEPGKIVYIEDLMKSMQPKSLIDIPLPALIMCVRDKEMKPFSIQMLRKYDENFSSLNFLFCPQWSEMLTEHVTKYIGIDMDLLFRDKLKKQHVKQLKWPLSKWVKMLGMNSEHINRLNITKPELYFADLSDDLLTLGKVLSNTSIFDITI